MKKIILLVVILNISLLSFSQFISYKPQLMGGTFNYNLILKQEFYYPPNAITANAQGEIRIDFLVDENGIPSDFKVIKSVYPSLDTAYINVLSHCLWEAGTHDGVKSAMRIQMKEKFKLKKYQNLAKKRGYGQPTYPFKPYNLSLEIKNPNQLMVKPKTFYKSEPVNIYKFIGEYIKVPDAALKQGLKGIVELEFVVETSGRLSNFKEIKGVGGGCTEEAIRLMRLMEWEPGMINNEYVRGWYSIKVNFGNTRY